MNRLALSFPTLLIAVVAGCGESKPPASKSSTMRQFIIGTTDFGIDPKTSSFTVDTTDPNRPTVTIELSGDQSVFDPLTVDEDSEWSWALYPPGFYLRSFPAQIDPSTGVVTASVKLEDIDKYEFAILMMEHNDIDDVRIKLIPQKSLKVLGRIDLFGEERDFAIHWQRQSPHNHGIRTKRG